MLKWIQGGISAVTGIAEPEYGREYIHTVTDRVRGKQPFNQTSAKDFEWQNPSHTHVETSTFYFTDLDSGNVGFAQVIHSNIVGLHTTAQFTFRLFNAKIPENNIWTSTKLENFRVEGTNFFADGLSIEMNQEGDTVHFQSTVNDTSKVDLTFKRIAPGVKVGEDPVTYYGDNVEEPWGTMRHVFWPRNSCCGTLEITKEGEDTQTIAFSETKPAYSMFVMALQGMKPHHAAKSWNFMNFQSDTHSVVLMEYTTPKSYANTKVSVGILCSDKEVLAVTIDNDAEHVDSTIDSVGWPVPKKIKIDFNGIASTVPDEEVSSATPLKATVSGPLRDLVERIDVMSEIPSFVKNIVSGVAGTKPYIYQYFNEMALTIDEGQKIDGLGWCEVTFISEAEEVTQESYDEN